MGITNMLGGYIGAHIAIKQGAKWVRWIFIVMAIVVGIKLIAEFFERYSSKLKYHLTCTRS